MAKAIGYRNFVPSGLSLSRISMSHFNSYFKELLTTSVICVNDQCFTLSEFLSQQRTDIVDISCIFGDQLLPVRLVARRLSEKKAKQNLENVTRAASKAQHKVSKEVKIVSCWQVYITNIESSKCTLDEVTTLYSVHWQIELIFKLWKSHLKLDQSNGKKGPRVLCEKLLKIIYLLIFHCHEILSDVGPVCEISHVEVLKRFKMKAKELFNIIPKGVKKIKSKIKNIVKFIKSIPKRSKRLKHPSTFDKLQNDKLDNKLYESFKLISIGLRPMLRDFTPPGLR